MNEISAWFESVGIHPVLGGLLLGALLVFVLMRGRRSGKSTTSFDMALGSQTGLDPGKLVSSLRSSETLVGGAHIHLEYNGKAIDIPPELGDGVMNALRRGNKIEAIKLLRGASGLDLVDAKHFVETMEKSGLLK